MKKIVLAVLALCMVLTVSCKPDKSDNKAESSPFPEYKSYMQNSSYEKALNDNPIDKDYSETHDDTIYATLDIVERESKYADLWQAEIDNALEILTESLSSEKLLERLPENLPDKDMVKALTESQENWEQYCKSCISLAEGVHMSSAGWGSEIQIFTASEMLNMKRQRALELAEYCMQLTGEYEFVFQNQN